MPKKNWFKWDDLAALFERRCLSLFLEAEHYKIVCFGKKAVAENNPVRGARKTDPIETRLNLGKVEVNSPKTLEWRLFAALHRVSIGK